MLRLIVSFLFFFLVHFGVYYVWSRTTRTEKFKIVKALGISGAVAAAACLTLGAIVTLF